MAITTYAELQTAIGNWLERSDLTSRIPEFISLFEAHANRRLKTMDQEVRATATFDAEYIALPDDFLRLKAINIEATPDRALEYMAPAAFRGQLDSALSGQPYFYTIEDGQIKLLPTPDTSYTGEIIYLTKVPVLSDSNTSNWLLTAHPDVYLYGALLQAEGYLVNDARIPLWKAAVDEAIEDINTLGVEQRKGTRMRQRPRAVY